MFSCLQMLRHTVSPSVVALLSNFDDPQNQEIPLSSRRGTGVFIDPTLIVTSARLVGHVSTIDDTERGSILHNCLIARTIAITMEKKVLRTTPVAVDLARDVAVLKVISAEGRLLPPPCEVANAVAKEGTPLLGMERQENFTGIIVLVAQSESAMGRTNAPWPLRDDLEWINFGVRTSSPDSTVLLSGFSGAPWFNYKGEIIGLTSWMVIAPDGYTYTFSIPSYSINSIIAYARTKSSDDPIIMDDSINSLIVARHLDDEEIPISEPRWINKFSVRYL